MIIRKDGLKIYAIMFLITSFFIFLSPNYKHKQSLTVAVKSIQTTIITTTTTASSISTTTTRTNSKPTIPRASRNQPRVVRPTNWQAVADCESGTRDKYGNVIPGTANWSINTGNGYYGGLQFLHTTWISNGGGQFAPNAHLTTRENQIAIASTMSISHWPVCGRKG